MANAGQPEEVKSVISSQKNQLKTKKYRFNKAGKVFNYDPYGSGIMTEKEWNGRKAGVK